MTQTQTIFIIDDQASVREALAEMLSVFGYNVETFESADVFLSRLDGERSGCIVADVRMPGMDGIELTREIVKRQITLPIVLISGHGDVPMAVAAIKAGAEDFIEKPVDDIQLIAAINRGLAHTTERITQSQSLQSLKERFERLTRREAEVFDLVVQGLTSQSIGSQLDISPRTVESYRVQIMEKMQAESVAVLVRYAVRLGRIAP